MIELLYGSAACRPMSRADIDDLLTVCRNNNAAKGITGLLLYQDGNFIQALEGEASVVDDLFRTIARDSRHAGVQILSRGEIERRSFESWSMGFRELPPSEDKEVDGLFSLREDTLASHLSADSSLRVRTLLRSFYRITSVT